MSFGRSNDYVSTGVQGLDNVLLGGFLKGGFYLFQGDPGSGKTTVALQFIQSRIAQGDKCLYVSITESRADLERACKSHGWTLDGVELSEFARSAEQLEEESHGSVFHPADTELTDITMKVLEEINRVEPTYIVFDGLSELRLLAGDPLRYRRTLLSLKELFARHGITAVLLDDRTAAFSEVQPESLVGGNIILERHLPAYGRARRRLYVTKVRGAHFREGYHDYDIVTGGVIVHPRLVAGDHHAEFDSALRPTGVSNLDQMLGGGLTNGSTALLLGPAGAGKSTVGMQFVVDALRKGEKAAVYIFDEVMNTFLERSEKLGFGNRGGIRAYIDEGALHAQQIDPAELSPGAFAHEVRRAVENGAKVIVIDSLNGYLNAMPEEGFLTTHLHELFAYLNQNGVLTLVIVSQRGMLASGSAAHSDVDVSYLADSVLLFRHFEAHGELRQAISVVKKRTGPHERTIRQISIDGDGISISEPLRELRGVTTGVPRHEPDPLSPQHFE